MSVSRSVCLAALLGLAGVMSTGCNSSTEVPLADVPQIRAPDPTDVPKDVQKGGGSGSSGNMNFNPGASS